MFNIAICDDQSYLKYGGFKFLCRLKEQKLVKNIGFSYHDDAELLDEILTKYPEMDFYSFRSIIWTGTAQQFSRALATRLPAVTGNRSLLWNL